MLRKWAQGAAAVLRVKVRASGPAPRPPFMLVSNHLSYLDIVVLATRLDCTFIGKKEVATWPLIGVLSKSLGAIFIDRGNKRDILRVNEEIRRAFADGKGVVLFAEGTTTRGDRVLPFKSGLLQPAAISGMPVAHAALSYRTPDHEMPAWMSVCWWGDMTLADHLAPLLRLSEISATLKFGAMPIRDTNRKILAKRLHSAVTQDFTPVVAAEEDVALKLI